MSSIQKLKKDKQNRLNIQRYEITRRYLTYLKRQALRLGLYPLETMAATKYRNFCLVSGKARSIYSKAFRMSRHQIKAYFKFIYGLKQSSW
jgi:ribosomal protein S14